MNRRRAPRPYAFIAAATAAVAFSGCRASLMPTPVIFERGVVDPLAHVAPEEAGTIASIFVATTRGVREGAAPGSPDKYTSDRDADGAVRLARAAVRFGNESTTWPEILEASVEPGRKGRPFLDVVSVNEYGVLWTTAPRHDTEILRNRVPQFEAHLANPDPAVLAETEAFLTDIRDALARSNRKDIYIYVHGFNTSFRSSTTVAASIWHYLGRDGVMISFAWPSQNSIFAYSADKVAASVAERGLRLLLLALNAESGAERIHIIAHSAGSETVVGALNQLRLMAFQRSASELVEFSRIGQVVLAAPDIDVGLFANATTDAFDQLPKHTTIYISTKDDALNISESINGFARLGNPVEVIGPRELEQLRRSDTMSIIDVAEAQRRYRDFFGHSYFHDNPWVNSDLLLVLTHGASPAERGLARDDDSAFWRFPSDHEPTVRREARALFGVDATDD